MARKPRWHGLMTLVVFCLVCKIGKVYADVYIDHSRHDYKVVPQDLDGSVTHLVLSYNHITFLDSGSFMKYTKSIEINLGHNSIENILPGTFDNNKHLKRLNFAHCKIRYLPPSFGPSAPFIEELGFNAAIQSNSTRIIRNQYLAQFSSLTSLGLKYVHLFTLEDIFFPRSLQTLAIGHTKLVSFPNVSANRLPALKTLRIQYNAFQVIPDYMFSGMADSLTRFDAFWCDLNFTPNFALKSNLNQIDLRGNNLETQLDLLAELPKLKKLRLESNRRWTCDKRLCWWRLWGRVRKEINFDNPRCMNPQWMRNFTLREINPKFMDCSDGKILHKLILPSYLSFVSLVSL